MALSRRKFTKEVKVALSENSWTRLIDGLSEN